MMKVTQKGDFKKTEGFFKNVIKRKYTELFHQIGEAGVKALQEATPKKTGKTAESWSYSVEETKNGLAISWSNSNRNDGANVAILIQLGHGTGTGAYVQGVDYINPALKPVFDTFANKVWWEVTRNAYNRR